MTIDERVHRSRRAVLAAGLGGLAAAAASSLGRPEAVRAADGGNMLIGNQNNSSNATTLINGTADHNGLFVEASGFGTAVAGQTGAGTGVQGTSQTGDGVVGSSSSAYGVHGSSSSSYGVYGTSATQIAIYGESASHSGVLGTSTNSVGVSGTSPNGSGVAGSSGIGVGVVGSSNATNQAGVRGSSGGDATGVMGYSGSSTPATAPAKTGVYGQADQDATAKGAWGKSATGHGLHGTTSSGTAIYGSTGGLKKGLALRTIGRIRFDHSVGLATIKSGTKSVTVIPGINLMATSAVVATIQGNPSGTMTVRSVAVDATADTFTIYLTANATVDMTIAWHVFG